MKTYEKPMVEIENLVSDTAVAAEQFVSAADTDIWNDLFGNGG